MTHKQFSSLGGKSGGKSKSPAKIAAAQQNAAKARETLAKARPAGIAKARAAREGGKQV